jgi:hypothetical protein
MSAREEGVTEETGQPKKSARRAAAYLRTARQDSSLDQQSETIHAYAETRGFEIVRTFTDRGRSGINTKGREAFQEMLALVESGRGEFEAILVYDFSRWGRFGADEAAYYELLCRRGGVEVRYCLADLEDERVAENEPPLPPAPDALEKCELELQDLLPLLRHERCDALLLYPQEKHDLQERALVDLRSVFERFGLRVHVQGMQIRSDS